MYRYRVEVLPSSNPSQIEAYITKRAETGERLSGIIPVGIRPYAVWESIVDEELVDPGETVSMPAPEAPKRGRGRPRKDEPFQEPESTQPTIVKREPEPKDDDSILPGVEVKSGPATGFGISEALKHHPLR